MMRFWAFGFLCFLCVGEASADVKVFFAPKSTTYETNTSAEIKKYIEDLVGGKVVDLSDNPKAVNKSLGEYLKKIKGKTSVFFGRNEMSKYNGTVCKISITTGNTAPSDPILTQVFTLGTLVDNNSEPCRELNNKLMSVVSRDDVFKYPAVVKDYGMLSMDMIFYFNNN